MVYLQEEKFLSWDCKKTIGCGVYMMNAKENQCKGESKMKKTLVLLAVLFAFMLPALGEGYNDAPPQFVWDALGDKDALADYISFTLPDGTVRSFSVDAYGSLQGYVCKDGTWEIHTQTSPVDGTWQPAFVRHDLVAVRADGSTYPDALGFDLVNQLDGSRISYHYDGAEFVICGWEKPDEYAGAVIMRGLTASYYPKDSSTAEKVAVLGEYANSMLMTFDELPGAPGEAQSLAAITEEALADYFPGYTLRSYWAYNENTEASACYSRVADGTLYVRRAEFDIDKGVPAVTDCLPVPLSEEVLSRLETEPFEDLLSATRNGLAKTPGFFDTQKIPVTGTVVDSDLQSEALILLTESDLGERYLHIVTEENGQYSVATTQKLPEDASLDIGHAGDGAVLLAWEGDRKIASFIRHADGSWRLNWVQDHDGIYYGYTFCGAMTTAAAYYFFDNNLVGNLPNDNLLTINVDALPWTEKELRAALDDTGWALVNNPNPADRLHLRAAADKAAASLGRFYNGTPVKVLKEKGDWCQVQIGTGLTGWMMKKYLAFGADMAVVKSACPVLMLTPEHEEDALFADDDLTQRYEIDGTYVVCGVSAKEQYIILTGRGEVVYAPQDWLYPGNG